MPTTATYFQISTLFCFASKKGKREDEGWYFGFYFFEQKNIILSEKVHDPSSIQERDPLRLLKKADSEIPTV